jgi:hypothetical protein
MFSQPQIPFPQPPSTVGACERHGHEDKCQESKQGAYPLETQILEHLHTEEGENAAYKVA